MAIATLAAAKHGRMFELIRQDNQAQKTSNRVITLDGDASDAALQSFRRLATRSLQPTRQATEKPHARDWAFDFSPRRLFPT